MCVYIKIEPILLYFIKLRKKHVFQIPSFLKTPIISMGKKVDKMLEH